jgi:hypothetical protein
METIFSKTLFFIIFSDRLTDLRKNKRVSNNYSRSKVGQSSVKSRSEEFRLTGKTDAGQIRSNPVKSGKNFDRTIYQQVTQIRSKAGQNDFETDRIQYSDCQIIISGRSDGQKNGQKRGKVFRNFKKNKK